MGSPIIVQRVKYASLSYRILNYAKFKSRIGDGCFSVNNYQNFLSKSLRPSDVIRSVNSLLNNGHLVKVGGERFRFVDTQVLAQIDFKHKDRRSAAHAKRSNEQWDSKTNQDEFDEF